MNIILKWGHREERPHTHNLQLLDLLLDGIGVLFQDPHFSHLLPLFLVLKHTTQWKLTMQSTKT